MNINDYLIDLNGYEISFKIFEDVRKHSAGFVTDVVVAFHNNKVIGYLKSGFLHTKNIPENDFLFWMNIMGRKTDLENFNKVLRDIEYYYGMSFDIQKFENLSVEKQYSLLNKMIKKRKNEYINQFKQFMFYNTKPIVEYVEINDGKNQSKKVFLGNKTENIPNGFENSKNIDYRNIGLGKILYCLSTIHNFNRYGMPLYGSDCQTNFAKFTWNSMIKKDLVEHVENQKPNFFVNPEKALLYLKEREIVQCLKI